MTTTVDPHDVAIASADVAQWLLFFLECHGAAVVLHADHHVTVDLDRMPGLDAARVATLGPAIVRLLPEMRQILIARGRA